MLRAVVSILLGLVSVLSLGHVAAATLPGLRDEQVVMQQLAWLRRVVPSSAPGMQSLFPEGEFFTWALTGLTAGALARQGISREENLAVLEQAIEATGRAEVTRRFGRHPEPLPHGAFLHGWRLLLLVDRAALTGMAEHREEVTAQAEAIVAALEADPFPTSYPGQAWPCDIVVALAAAHRAHELAPVAGLPEVTRRWFEASRSQRDPDTGLLVHRVGETRARGTSQVIIQTFLPDIDPEVAVAEWRVFKERFVSSRLGLVGVLEYAEGHDGNGDVDSGPLIMGVSASASAVALAAARRHGDLRLATALDREADLLGVPLPLPGGRGHAFGLLPVGDAFLAWARSTELGPELGDDAPEPWWWLFWVLALVPATIATGLQISRRRPRAGRMGS